MNAPTLNPLHDLKMTPAVQESIARIFAYKRLVENHGRHGAAAIVDLHQQRAESNLPPPDGPPQ